jgi:ATP-binding cassette subfamily B protein
MSSSNHRQSRSRSARRLLGNVRAAIKPKPGKKSRAPVRMLFPLLAGRRWQVVALAACSIASALAEATILVIVVRIALAISTDHDSVKLELGPLNMTAGVGALFAVGLLLAVVRLVLQLVAAYLPARMSADVQVQLRKSLLEQFLHSTWDVQSREREGHLQELLTTQVSKVSMAVLLLSDSIAFGFNFLTLMVSAIILNPPAALSIVIAAVVLFFLLRPLARLIRHQSQRRVEGGLEYAGSISETVRMLEEVQAFGVADQQRRVLDRWVDHVARYQFRMDLLSDIVRAVYQNAAITFVLIGLGVVYLSGSAQVASLGAVALILVRGLGYSQAVQSSYHKASELAPYLETLRAREARFETNRARSGDTPLERITQLGFEGVRFEYTPGIPVLHDVSFQIARGEATGVVGPTGAGKSTLVQIILRLRQPSGGELVVNGRSAEQYRIDDWRRLVAFLPQSPELLNATVADNIRFLREGISDEAVERAARTAHIHDEIMAMPLGYHTVIGHRANAVSGGQRQRICMARALVTGPDVLILDEPTSALDVRSESLIQQSLEALKGEMTIICIAHRLSTLNLTDRIIVMREGRLEAFDTAETLVRSNGFYREAVELSRLP